jgi:hypothetical protein
MDESSTSRMQAAIPRSSGMRMILGAALIAFLLGVAATWYLTRSADFLFTDLFRLKSDETAAQTAAAPTTTAVPLAAPATVAEVVEQQGGLDQRVAAMEQRLTRLDLQAQAASGNAARAEGLLIAFAARRAVVRGAPRDFNGGQLQLRLGEAQPNAVRTVIEAAGKPVTLDQLLARLDGLAPQLAEAPNEEGPFDWLSRQLSSLFVVRREDAPSPAPERRIERARLFLQSGRIDAAVSEVRNLPNAEQARGWIADAERYAAAQKALDLIETAAIIEPRELRDGAGDRVVQPSPGASR